MADEQKSELTHKELPLRYRILGRMPALTAHNLLIQVHPESVVLAFFETVLPAKVEYTPEDLKELEEVGIVAECVARINLPPGAFLQAAEAMQKIALGLREKAAKQREDSAKL